MGIFSLLSRRKSPSHERQLEHLVNTIHKTHQRLARLQLSHRRRRAAFSFYTIIVGILYSIGVLVLEQYRRQWILVALIPVWIGFVVLGRRGLDRVYKGWIERAESRLERLRAEQISKLEEIKKATHFYETQALLMKFGDENLETGGGGGGGGGDGLHTATDENVKAGIQQQQQTYLQMLLQAEQAKKQQEYEASAERRHHHQQQQQLESEGDESSRRENQSWSNRIMDYVLGEDELSEKNRFALICANCFAHNGLARPGTQHPDTVKYCCPTCGFWNGMDDLSKAIFAQEEIVPEIETEDTVEDIELTEKELTSSVSMIDTLNSENNTLKSRKTRHSVEPEVDDEPTGITTGKT